MKGRKALASGWIVRTAVLGGVLIGAPAFGQNEQATPATPPVTWGPAPTTIEPQWSTPAIGKVAGLLAGTWKTTSPVRQSFGDAGATANIVMNIAAVKIAGVTDALYVETARVDAPWEPYRQAIFQLYTFKGKVRLRTYEFYRTNAAPALVGVWAAPQAFPEMSREDLIATLDVELTEDGNGFKGKTPYPYPTGMGGAVEMTSELDLRPTSLTSVDRGFDAAGTIVWGSKESEKYTFAKSQPDLVAYQSNQGLIKIDTAPGAGEDLVDPGEKLTVHYSGWLRDGSKFDSSRDRPTPFQFVHGSLIPGWNEGMTGAKKGTRRRLIIPPALAYAERGAGRTIPPNSTLYFETEIMGIESIAPPPAPADTIPKPANTGAKEEGAAKP